MPTSRRTPPHSLPARRTLPSRCLARRITLPLPLLLLFLALLAAGCASLKPAPPLTRRVAVLDFRAPEDYEAAPTVNRGWWFGARTLMRNPQMGALFADDLGRSLTSLEYVEQHSRTDVRIYMASKRRLLTSRFKDRTDQDYSRMLAEVSPVDYGEELGVDQILTGRVVEAYTSKGHVFDTWHSYVKVELDLWDMRAGQEVWTTTFSRNRWFTSDVTTAEELADQVARALDRHYRSAR